ncbi:MAG: SPFH domain-containing protein [Patescibacteria group bacterium]
MNGEKIKSFGKVFWGPVVIVCGVSFFLDLVWLSRYSMSGEAFGLDIKWNWGLAAFLAQLFYLIASLRMVGPTELGARLFFGKPLSEISSGLVFIPFGICELKTETRLTIQDEIPGPPERIWREKKGEEGGEVPLGYVPPIRIPFGFPRSAKDLKDLSIKTPGGDGKHLDAPPENDALNIRITAEVVPVIRWRISDYLKFLTTIGSREEARRQLEDCAVGSLIREFAKIAPAVALANLGTYSFNLGKEIEERIKGWGIELVSSQIKMIQFHRDLNEAISKVSQAKLEAEALIASAEARKKEEHLLGEGKGAAEKAVLDGRTEGLRNMIKALEVPAQVIIGAETARKITENPGQKTIVAGSAGFADLMAIGSVLGESLKGESPKKESLKKDFKKEENKKEEKK